MVVCMNGVDHVLTKEQAGLRKRNTWLLTRAWEYNLSTLSGTYFECYGISQQHKRQLCSHKRGGLAYLFLITLQYRYHNRREKSRERKKHIDSTRGLCGSVSSPAPSPPLRLAFALAPIRRGQNAVKLFVQEHLLCRLIIDGIHSTK